MEERVRKRSSWPRSMSQCDVTPMWFKGWEAELKHSVLDRNACLAAPALLQREKGMTSRNSLEMRRLCTQKAEKKNTQKTHNLLTTKREYALNTSAPISLKRLLLGSVNSDYDWIGSSAFSFPIRILTCWILGCSLSQRNSMKGTKHFKIHKR